MLQTMDLSYIYEELEDNIFDFEYEFEDITINNVIYNKELIEKRFLQVYYYYQIGFSSLSEFKWRFKNNWLEKIEIFKQKLSLYPINLNLNDEEINTTYSRTNDNKYSDTPNQPMLNVDLNGKYLTDRTYINDNGDRHEVKTKNTLMKYNQINNAIKNIEYEFYNSFDNLFITDVIINNYI